MARLRGEGVGVGQALGTAVVLRISNGIPLLPELPPSLRSLLEMGEIPEKPDLILVAPDYAIALSAVSSLPWGQVVGIAASVTTNPTVTALPAVINIPDLMNSVTEGSLLLLDAGKGVLFTDPDPIFIAQYQADHDRIAPKRRIFLDDQHQSAITLDGREISVLVEVANREALNEALALGADILYPELPGAFMGHFEIPSLDEYLREGVGKPLFFEYESEERLLPLLEAATQADITLIFSLDEVPLERTREELQNLVHTIKQKEEDATNRDEITGQLRLGVALADRTMKMWQVREEVEELISCLSENGYSRILFYGMLAGKEHLERFTALVSLAATHLIPVYVYMSDQTIPDDEIAKGIFLMIGTGVHGILLDMPAMVPQVKNTIRTCRYSDCQAELLSLLNTP